MLLRDDLVAMAEAQGFEGLGPLYSQKDLAAALQDAARRVENGARVLVDARLQPGYATNFGGTRETP